MNIDVSRPPIRIDRQGDLAILTLDRPEKRNAISAATWRALPSAAAEIEADDTVKVVIVTGAGGHFSAGADISEFEQTFATTDSAVAYAAEMGEGIEAIAAMRKPVLAAIDGVCIGGGVALALACDIRIAAADARFAITPAKLGMLYPPTDTRRLAACVGISAAKRMLFGAAVIDGREALAIGLADCLAEPGEAMLQAKAEATRIAGVSQYTVHGMKRFLDGLADPDADARQSAAFIAALEGPDFHEGRAAFMERRAPKFTFR